MVDSSDDDQVDPVIIGRENDGLGDWNDYKPDEYKPIPAFNTFSSSVLCHMLIRGPECAGARLYPAHIFRAHF